MGEKSFIPFARAYCHCSMTIGYRTPERFALLNSIIDFPNRIEDLFRIV